MQTNLNDLLDGLKNAVDPSTARRFVEAFKLDAVAAADLPAATAGLATALESVSHIAAELGLQGSADLASAFAAAFAASSARPKAGTKGTGVRPTFSAAKFPLLSSFLAARPNDIATRVDGIRLLILSSALHGGGASAEKIVADGLRKTLRFPADWGVLVRSLPAPADSSWLLHLPAAIQRAGRTVKTRKKFAHLAHLEFLTSLLTLARIVRPDLVRDVTFFEREVEAADDGDLQDEATDMPGGMPDEPTLLPARALWIPKQQDSGFAEQPALIEAESGSADAPESRTTAAASVRAHVFRLSMLDQRLRWAWEHLNPFDLRVLRGHVLEGLEKCEPAAMLCVSAPI